MRALILTAAVGLSAIALAAAAQPAQQSVRGDKTPATLCLDPGGNPHPPICHKQNASRFPAPPDICLCNGPYRQVDAPWCAPGEHPPAETADFDRARLAAAQDGSLFGDTYKGQRMCVRMN